MEQKKSTQRLSRGVSGPEHDILAAVHTHHFMTVDQVCRLLYSPGSAKYVRDSLKDLTDRGYLQRLRLPSVSAGNTPYIYTIARKGISYLTMAGIADVQRFRPSEHLEHSYLFLSHTLAVNDFLISARLLEEEVEGAVLVEMLHERSLRRTPVRVTTARNETMAIVPDGWLDFQLRGQSRMSILLEMDRGTTEQKMFKRKLRGLLAYALGAYQDIFQSESLTIAFPTTGGAHRAELMRRWTQDVLKDLKEERHADVFLFAALPDTVMSPKTLFFSRMWSVPYGVAHVPLLEW